MTINAVVARWDEMVREGCYYDNSGRRCDPWSQHHGRDCSTFAADGLNAGFPGCIDLCSNSFSQAAWCYETPRPDWFVKRFGPGQGTFISYEQAQSVVCLGFRGSDWGMRPDFTGDGHTECGLGQKAIGRPKRTVGAHSHATGVGYDEDGLDTHMLSYFAIPPCFLTEMAGPPIDGPTLEAIKKLLEWQKRVAERPLRQGMTNGDVTIANDLLIHRRLMAKSHKSNTFSRYTRAANHRMKAEAHFADTNGNVLGGAAAAQLLHP